jgi:hypothetical protein
MCHRFIGPDATLILFHSMLENANLYQVNEFGWAAVMASQVATKPATVIELFDQMRSTGLEPDVIIYRYAVNACAKLRDLDLGKKIHEMAIASGLKPTEVLDSALTDMYSRCGNIQEATRIFKDLIRRQVRRRVFY